MKDADRSVIRALSLFVLCVVFLSSCAAVPIPAQTSSTKESNTPEDVAVISPLPSVPAEHRVAYIPLDNRPVNQERVIYLAQSAGIELLLPNEALYRTALDNMAPNPDGSTMGNREALLAWLQEVDSTCDYFIISLDQMTSGGLVSSRALTNPDLSLEYHIIDAILALGKENTVYVFDTVMRLASTVNYQGCQLAEYNAFRSYGSVARELLLGEALTVENIIAGYPYDSQGERIFIDVSEEMQNRYHAARARKLKIIDYLLQNDVGQLDFLYIGVDDSSPQNTIQSNEIAYIKEQMGARGALSAAADELGMCCLARLACELYGKVSLNVTYYGPGEHQPADAYDIGTLAQGVGAHLSALSVIECERADAVQVLLLTRGSTQAHREALLQQLLQNQKGNIPTVLIDVSEAPAILSEQLFADQSIDVCRLLGYSSWNTAANALGIALSQGVARHAYLQAVDISSRQATNGFLRSIAFAYVKDISYKCFAKNIDALYDNANSCTPQFVADRLGEGSILVSLTEPTAYPCVGVEFSNFRYPWDRTFEVTFDIQTKE